MRIQPFIRTPLSNLCANVSRLARIEAAEPFQTKGLGSATSGARTADAGLAAPADPVRFVVAAPAGSRLDRVQLGLAAGRNHRTAVLRSVDGKTGE